MLFCKRGLSALLCLAMVLLPVSALSAGAAADGFALHESVNVEEVAPDDAFALPEEVPEDVNDVPVEEASVEEALPQPLIVLNGEPMRTVRPVLVGSTTWVPVRQFCEALGCRVSWNNKTQCAQIDGTDMSLNITVGSSLLCCNGRYWYMSSPCSLIGGRMMLPVRELAKVFTCTVHWSQKEQTVYLTGGAPLAHGDEVYDPDDVLWLSRIIQAEAGNQELRGKVAVANVVLHRVESKLFPNNIHDVIFDRVDGIQFTPAYSGRVYCTPSSECVFAAKLALEGYDVVPGCLYFISVKSSSSSWAGRHRPCFGSIGSHMFYL